MVAYIKNKGTYAITVSSGNTTGTSGTSGRTITLNNTLTTTDDGMLIFVNTSFIHTSEVTIVHNSSSSTITFDSLDIWDGDKITVRYEHA